MLIFEKEYCNTDGTYKYIAKEVEASSELRLVSNGVVAASSPVVVGIYIVLEV